METALRRLVDESRILDVVHRYALFMDRKEWGEVRACFADQIEVDFRGTGRKDIFRGSADDWVADIRKTVDAMDCVQNMISNPVHVISGDTALSRCEFHLVDLLANTSGDSRFDAGGFYDFSLARHGDTWKITQYSAKVIWRSGNPYIFSIAHAKSQKNKA